MPPVSPTSQTTAINDTASVHPVISPPHIRPAAPATPAPTAKTLATSLTSCVVIPARMASTRLPDKMLLAETGKPLIQHTCEAAALAKKPASVWVATDHEAIEAAVRSFGGNVIMTDPDLPSGTDRVAEVARRLDDVDIVVNLQGDEPDLSGVAIDRAVALLEEHPEAVMSTLATPIRNRGQLDDPGCVKVVFDESGRALYFSRSPIPHPREWDESLLTTEPANFYQHVGLYAYRREFLLGLSKLPPCPLEQIERLEQLRVLNAGHQILVAVVDEPSFGIDTEHDYRTFVERRLKR
jgi:3-deoxy-manno-octulosonate cytidylyltransferase (CMP-KDO synthetase)